MRIRDSGTGQFMAAPVEQRFWSKVDTTEVWWNFYQPAGTYCWTWTGRLDNKGYGVIYRSRTQGVKAHRFSYELVYGAIPEGLQLDHLCRNRACVRPDHLEAVTSRTNTLRGETLPARWLNRDRCERGHLYDADNTMVLPAAGRRCRACNLLRSQAHRERMRAKRQQEGLPTLPLEQRERMAQSRREWWARKAEHREL